MVEVAVITKPLADLTPKIGGVVVLAIHNCAERLSFWIIPTRLAVDTPSRGGKAVAHQRSAGSGVCQPFGGLV
jgi:hypothetical protein